MANGNILAEKEFDISLHGRIHKVKATAVFLVHGIEPQEVGIYLLDFTLRLIIREKKQDGLPSLAFSSGQVESYAKRQIQSWINLGR
jgi:hypothetical protein